MVEDDPQGNKQHRRAARPSGGSGNAGGGLGGGLGSLIGNVLPFLFKRPKLLIVLVVVGIALYFFMGKGCSASGLLNEGASNFFRGGELNKEVYEQTEIFEPLADNKKNPLPERVDLRKYCPTPKNQGKQGSCVAWASAYAARTILEAQRTGKNPDDLRFSPSFMYNQISIDHNSCQGSYIKYAMDNMMEVGAVPFNDFRYDDSDCNRQPDNSLKRSAQVYKIKGFQRLTDDSKSNAKAYESLAIKQTLAKGSPVIIGMMVGGTFMQHMMGKEFWNPSSHDYLKQGFGGHAMCIVGYDDYYEGGAFLLMNSWGTEWGKNGFAWVRYSDFRDFNVESYGLYPMGNADKQSVTSFEGSFGLELNNGKKTLALKRVNDHYFETVGRVTQSDKFKVEFTNTAECYTYIFGEETDGSCYTLFPYTAKHSPYCGITGTRLFPRDYSMVPDDKGQKDKIAVVITRKPIDYEDLKKRINAAKGSSFEEKMATLLLPETGSKVRFSGSEIINFKTDLSTDQVVWFVIGMNK